MGRIDYEKLRERLARDNDPGLMEFYEEIYLLNEKNIDSKYMDYSCNLNDPRWMSIYYDVSGKYLFYSNEKDFSTLPSIIDRMCGNDKALKDKVNEYVKMYTEYEIRTSFYSLDIFVERMVNYSRDGNKVRKIINQ